MNSNNNTHTKKNTKNKNKMHERKQEIVLRKMNLDTDN